MVRFSMLMMTTFLVGLFIFSSGVACLFKGLYMHKAGDTANGTLIIIMGVMLVVFGPVVMVLSAIYYMMRARRLRDAGQW